MRSLGWGAALGAMLVMASAGLVGAQTPEEEPAQVQREAWWTAPTSDAFPPILTSEVPPGVVCLLVPETCAEEVEAVTGVIEEQLTGIEIPGGPVQPVQPGTLPVGLLGGHERYSSGILFQLPQVPEGQTFALFRLRMHEAPLTFAMESPAFRALVRAFIAQAADDPSPDPFISALTGIAEGEHGLLIPEPTGVEVCAANEGWEEGENQEAEDQPERDCVFGATGERGEDGVWTFDLTFTAQAWLDGTLPFHGIVLSPVAPENLEYGDPDISANFVVSMHGGEADDDQRPTIEIAFMDDPAAFVAAPPPPPPTAAPPIGPPQPFGPAPPTIDAPTDVPPAETAPPPTPASSPAGDPFIPWPMWLLVPLGAAGTALFTKSLGMAPVAAVAHEGALTRLTRAARVAGVPPGTA